MDKLKLFIACPTKWISPARTAPNPFTRGSFGYNLWELGKHGIEIEPPREYDESPLDEARNVAVEEFLESDCSHLLFWDDDQVFTTGTFIRLVESAVEVDSKVTSGWYQARKGTGTLVVFRRMPGKKLRNYDDFSFYKPYSIRELTSLPFVETKHGKLVQVDGIGMGCCLIRRDTFDKLDYPYFLQWSPSMKREVHRFGEDLFLSDCLAEAGIPIYVNLKCFVGHWTKQGVVIGQWHLKQKAYQEGIIDLEGELR